MIFLLENGEIDEECLTAFINDVINRAASILADEEYHDGEADDEYENDETIDSEKTLFYEKETSPVKFKKTSSMGFHAAQDENKTAVVNEASLGCGDSLPADATEWKYRIDGDTSAEIRKAVKSAFQSGQKNMQNQIKRYRMECEDAERRLEEERKEYHLLRECYCSRTMEYEYNESRMSKEITKLSRRIKDMESGPSADGKKKSARKNKGKGNKGGLSISAKQAKDEIEVLWSRYTKRQKKTAELKVTVTQQQLEICQLEEELKSLKFQNDMLLLNQFEGEPEVWERFLPWKPFERKCSSFNDIINVDRYYYHPGITSSTCPVTSMLDAFNIPGKDSLYRDDGLHNLPFKFSQCAYLPKDTVITTDEDDDLETDSSEDESAVEDENKHRAMLVNKI